MKTTAEGIRKHAKKSRVVCFVGISGKPGKDGPVEPLSEKTLSGKVITEVEMKLRDVEGCSTFVRDNLVDDPPLQNGKLRYPTPTELHSEWSQFEERLTNNKSNVVILLGRIVADFFREQRDIEIINNDSVDGLFLKWAGVDKSGQLVLAVAHPSYIGVYARKRIADYAETIFNAMQEFFR